jgi:hypothetical protein
VRQVDSLSQEVLDAILARALEAKDRPEDQPVFSVHRDILPSWRVVDLASEGVGSARVAARDVAGGRSLELGALVGGRRVGPFDVRLVRARDADGQGDAWRVASARVRGGGVVVLTYASGSVSAREVATRYAEEATESDLASDFDPAAHYFGERRASRRA